MVAFSTLQRIAVVGGVIAVGTAGILTEKVQANFREQGYYKKAMYLLRRYKPAVDAFGEPIKSKKLKLQDPNHFCDGLNARLTIPLKGPSDKGNLFVWASRESGEDSWNIDKLDIEVKSSGRKWTFYQPDSTKPES